MTPPPPLPLAARYQRFRDDLFLGLEEPETLPGFDAALSEIELQSLWFSGAFGSEFQLEDGRNVTIQDFGIWNSGPGPDFVETAIRIGKDVHRGAIELDPDARDWERHRHGQNADYNRVILHIYVTAPESARFYTRTEQHTEVPQLRLRPHMLEADARPCSREAAARLGRCALPLRDMEPIRVTSLLESAAQFRLQRKSRRLHALIAAQGREQAVFQSLAQTLGYRFNQRPFAILAQRLPIRQLKGENSAMREALLFGAAGFLEDIRAEQTEGAARQHLRRIWDSWWKRRDACERWLSPQQRLRWKLAPVRPGNHPQRRLGALVALIDQWSAVSAPLMDATRWTLPGWRDTLLHLGHPFWSTHYTLLAEPAPRPIALIGSSRIHEMLANVVYPLLVPERTRLWAEYLELPALLDNQKIRRALQRLFGPDSRTQPKLRLQYEHQGLLQVYEDFCLEDTSACADCPFPERLKSWDTA
ncbi:MAG: DUF2851 family protein [Verrucomicrobiales bacterium]|nr:DUF2851 family protein [Verrucomicrobiales bacterium]